MNNARKNADAFLLLVNAYLEDIVNAGLATPNFDRACRNARHMVKGRSYSGGESQLVFNQLRKLQMHFAI